MRTLKHLPRLGIAHLPHDGPCLGRGPGLSGDRKQQQEHDERAHTPHEIQEAIRRHRSTGSASAIQL